MNQFDLAAPGWDKNQMHIERSEAVAKELLKAIEWRPGMKALEFGAGTGLLSFALKSYFTEITLMDNSQEMVNVASEKIERQKVKNLQAVYFDLEKDDYPVGNFDIIYSQMVFHHVADIESLIKKFHAMLNFRGILAIADLYKEDGSFHGEGFDGHNGFDTDELAALLEKNNFENIEHTQCYIIEREGMQGEKQEYPIFLLTAHVSKL